MIEIEKQFGAIPLGNQQNKHPSYSDRPEHSLWNHIAELIFYNRKQMEEFLQRVEQAKEKSVSDYELTRRHALGLYLKQKTRGSQ
jgi:hypothetical protein